MVMQRTLRELVQARLGDLDGHPEQVSFAAPAADNLGRPWVRGKKRRDRQRPTVMATSNGGSGATVSCEGNSLNMGRVSNGRHDHRYVGESMGTVQRTAQARSLSRMIREAVNGDPLENAIKMLHAALVRIRDNPAWETIENEGSARQLALVGDMMSLIEKFERLLPPGAR